MFCFIFLQLYFSLTLLLKSFFFFFLIKNTDIDCKNDLMGIAVDFFTKQSWYWWLRNLNHPGLSDISFKARKQVIFLSFALNEETLTDSFKAKSPLSLVQSWAAFLSSTESKWVLLACVIAQIFAWLQPSHPGRFLGCYRD